MHEGYTYRDLQLHHVHLDFLASQYKVLKKVQVYIIGIDLDM